MTGRLFSILFLIAGLAFSVAAEDRREIILAGTENGMPAQEILTEAFRRAGYKVKIRYMPWARCLSEARKGAIDGVYGASRTPGREADLLFTDEVLWQETQSAFARADDPAHYKPDPAGLAEIRLGLMKASATGPAFDQAIAGEHLHHVDYAFSFDSLLLMLTGRRVDVIIADRRSVFGIAKQYGVLDKLRELRPPVVEDPVYIAFTRSRDMSAVGRAVSGALREMKQDGSFAELFARHFQ